MKRGGMEQTTQFPAIGRQLKRTFIAFVLSYFIVYLQAWFAIEVAQLALLLERAGRYHRIHEFRKSSKLLLGARAAAIAAFILGLVGTMVACVIPFGYPLSYSINLDYQFALMIPFIRTIPIIIELGILSAAWKCLYLFFDRDELPDSRSRFLALKSTGRVRWGLGVTIAATVIRLIASGVSRYPNHYDYYSPYYGYLPYIPAILSLVGSFLLLLGTINAGVGMYDTSRAFLSYQDIPVKRPLPEEWQEREPRTRPSHEAYRELPFHPDNLTLTNRPPEQHLNAQPAVNYYTEIPAPRIKYCYNCGALLPQIAGLRFCPDCGRRMN